MKKILFGLSILCLVVVMASAVQAQTNILQNPGFEDGTGSPPPPWVTYGFGYPGTGTGGSFEMVTGTPGGTVHSGTKAFSVIGTTSVPIVGSNGPRQWGIPIDISGKTKYEWKTWIKKTSNLKVRIRWHNLDALGNIIASGYSLYDNNTTGVWKELTTGALQIVPGTWYVTFNVYVEPNTAPVVNTGTVYIDDCGLYATSGGTEFGKVVGSVKYNGVGIPNAFVGFKRWAGATSDPIMYTRTDANGNYGPVYIPNGTVYVAAWKEGWAPSADVAVTGASGVQVTANCVFTTSPGANLGQNIPSKPTAVAYSSQSGEATAAFDNDLTTAWSSVQSPSGGDEYIYIDLDTNGNTYDVEGVTLYWGHRWPSKYTIDYTTTDPNPIFGWTTIYSADPNTSTPGTGGFQADPAAPFVNAIRFSAPVNARGIRVHCQAYNGLGIPDYVLYECQIHYADHATRMGSVHGYVRDDANNPIPGAIVHLGRNIANAAYYRQAYSDEYGFYSFSWFAGPEVITADAFGKANVDTVVNLTSDGTSLAKDFQLANRSETNLVPNGGFETADPVDPSKPANWTMMEWDPQGEVILGRDTTHAHSGTACGILDMTASTDPESDDKWAGMYSSMFPIKGDGLHAYNVWMWRTGSGWETYRNTHRVIFLAEDQTTVTGGELYGFYGWGRWEADWDWWKTDAQYRLIPPAGSAYMIVDQIGSLIAVGNGDPPVQAVDDVVVEEVPLASPVSNSLKDAKAMQVGSPVSLIAKQLTSTGGGAVPAGYGFVEEWDRSAGAMLGLDFNNIAGDAWVGAGDLVNVYGTLQQTADGRKYIDVNAIDWLLDTRPIEALAMNVRAAQSPLAKDMLIKLTGKVTEVGSDYFMLDDGSVDSGNPSPIKVKTGSLIKPVQDQKVRVRGIVSSESGTPVLYMRPEQVDWTTADAAYQPLPFAGPVKALRDYLFLGVYGDAFTPQATQLATDYIAQATGGAITEATVRPSLGDAVGTKTWFRHDGFDEMVDLTRVFYPTDTHKVTIYAHVYVWSPIAQLVDIPLGSDDGIRVWVNGNLVFANDTVTRTLNYGQDNAASVMLNAGFNSVLIKVCNGSGDAFGLITQFAVPGSYLGPGWGGSLPLEGLGYLLNKQP